MTRYAAVTVEYPEAAGRDRQHWVKSTHRRPCAAIRFLLWGRDSYLDRWKAIAVAIAASRVIIYLKDPAGNSIQISSRGIRKFRIGVRRPSAEISTGRREIRASI